MRKPFGLYVSTLYFFGLLLPAFANANCVGTYLLENSCRDFQDRGACREHPGCSYREDNRRNDNGNDDDDRFGCHGLYKSSVNCKNEGELACRQKGCVWYAAPANPAQAAALTAMKASEFNFRPNLDFAGNNLKDPFRVPNPSACATACAQDPQCKLSLFVERNGACLLKGQKVLGRAAQGVMAFMKYERADGNFGGTFLGKFKTANVQNCLSACSDNDRCVGTVYNKTGECLVMRSFDGKHVADPDVHTDKKTF